MYMIPYFLENEAKKLLKVKLSEIINDVTNDLIDNIFRYNSDNKYENLMLNFEEKNMCTEHLSYRVFDLEKIF